MWPTTVVLGIVLACQVFGGEIRDVTTIYDIGHGRTSSDEDARLLKGITADPDPGYLNKPRTSPVVYESCIYDVKGRVHARTNALGLGIINEENQYFDYNPSEITNITYDANFDHVEHWELDGGMKWSWKWFSDLSAVCYGIPIIDGKANKIDKQLRLKRKVNKKTTYTDRDTTFIAFTQGPESLKNEKIYMVMELKSDNARLFYNCDTNSHSSPYLFNMLDRDGHTTVNVHCRSDYTSFNIQFEDYLTLQLSDGGGTVNFYTGKDLNRLVINWYFLNNLGREAHLNYFSVTKPDPDALTTAVPKALQITNGEMVSPFFTPQSNKICLAVIFHSSIASNNPVNGLEVSVKRMLLIEMHLETISFFKRGWNVMRVNISLENLDPIKLVVKTNGAAEISLARIASCSADGEEVIELSGISACPWDQRTRPWGSGKSSFRMYTTTVDVFDAAEIITNTTNYCWNGGELTSAGCACPPGFSGSKCETGCGRNRFGQDCEGLCSFYNEECRGLLMCTKFTGCHCAPGYHGDDCTQACTPGWYGNDCSQRCAHCARNTTCDIYTGRCSACEEGYLAPQCKSASVYYGSKPDLTSPSYNTIVVSFDPNNCISEGEMPQLYQIQLREKGQQWNVYTTKILQKPNDESEKNKKISEKIEGLKTGILYQVRVLLIDAYFQKYTGDLVQIGEVLTKCDIPSNYDYKVKAISNTTAVTFLWRYINEDINWCPLELFEVTWKEGWKSQSKFTTDNDFTLNGLVPGLDIKFKVRAKTSGGFAPYSKTTIISAQQTELPPVENLRVESSQSTSVELLWDPPRGSGDTQQTYIISYKCVDRPACAPGCQNVSEGQLTQEGTSMTLSNLLPFTKYLVTVKAEGGAESSIPVGTTKVVPTEVLVLSAHRPLRTNTSVTVFWDPVPVCSGYLLGYNYQLTKASEYLKILASGFTKETNASFHNLTASTEYVVRVFVLTIAGWNPTSYLSININTSATVPEAVRNLTVYKRGRGMLGLRWAEPRATYGQLKSFTVTHSLGQEVISHTVEPTRCVVWPDLYCHTIEGLRSNRRYNVTVSARNMEVSEDGEPATVTSITKESSPAAPVNLKLINSTSTSVVLQWEHPDLVNGILRSFLVSIEETEKFDQESCCQVYPLVETSVKDEYQYYDAEVSGLHPASTYFVSVSAKTVGLGPSQPLVVYTRPPHLPLTVVPSVLPSTLEVSWLPQDKLSEVNNSDVYSPLIRAHLLLAVLNDTQLDTEGSGITDPKLHSLLQQSIGKPFFFIAEYNQDDDFDLTAPLEDNDSPWGQPPASLSPEVSYQLAAVQVLEYTGVYNVDFRFSQPFILPN